MLKFILVVIVLFLAVRLVARLVRSGLFIIRKSGSFSRSGSSTDSYSSREHIDEIEYEVIESHLNNKEPDER
jgi:hypothetical protein